ncbi:hypothetical protein [Enterococcus olivae]
MIIAHRLIFFIAVLLTYYSCEKYPSTIQNKGPLIIKRVGYISLLIGLSYVISGLLFEFLMLSGIQYGNQMVTNLLTAGICSLLIVTPLSFLAPQSATFITADLRKMMLSVQLLLSLSTFTFIESDSLIKELLVYAGMYFFFTVAFAGTKDRISIAPIPTFIKGLPLDLLTLFLFLLSFSFLDGVFFDQLF